MKVEKKGPKGVQGGFNPPAASQDTRIEKEGGQTTVTVIKKGNTLVNSGFPSQMNNQQTASLSQTQNLQSNNLKQQQEPEEDFGNLAAAQR